jgi:hypothetical protein
MSSTAEDMRDKIACISQLAERASISLELTPAQRRSILLRKTMPDLAALNSGDKTRRHEDALAELE